MRLTHALVDLAAITVLAFAIYLPRYRRRDLLVSLLALNVGVLAVTMVLQSSAIGVGTGFGIFGALSIVRLRSDELAQQDVAYYFSAVALAILGGAAISPSWLAPVLSGMVLAAMYLGDHPALFARARQQVIVLDRAVTDERELVAHLEERLHAQITYFNVRKTDLVNDSTTVDVRYRLSTTTRKASLSTKVPERRAAA